MKVLEINSVCGYGSTGRIAVSLYSEIENSGGECLIAYGRKDCNFEGCTYKIGSDFYSGLHILKTRLFDRHGFCSKNPTKKLLEKIEEYSPDIIHLHNIHGYYLNVELLFEFIKAKNIPVVWTLHDCWPFTGHCAYFTKAGCEKWRTICSDCSQRREYPASYLADNSQRNYLDKKRLFTGVENLLIVTPSAWLKNLVEESFLGQYEVVVVNNGIDLGVFKRSPGDFRKKYHLENKYILLGVASIWEERKGLGYFVELSKKLDECFKIVLVGVSDKQSKELPQNIISIARTDSTEQLVEIYSSADLFVNPTLEDNFPTTNLEALACGTPVLTFATGGSAESIDEKTGFSVPTGDLESLLEIIRNLEFKNIKREDCLSRAELYSDKLKFKEYISIYKRLLEKFLDRRG